MDEMKCSGDQRQVTKSLLLMEPHRTHLITPATNCDNTYEMLSVREEIRKSVAKVFIGDWSYRYSLPGMYPNFSVPQRKQVFSVNYIVCTF